MNMRSPMGLLASQATGGGLLGSPQPAPQMQQAPQGGLLSPAPQPIPGGHPAQQDATQRAVDQVRQGFMSMQIPPSVKQRALQAFEAILASTGSIERAVEAANKAIPGTKNDLGVASTIESRKVPRANPDEPAPTRADGIVSRGKYR